MTDLRRFIIEMGQGVDLHGGDYTKAAGRAIEDAMRHSSIPMFGSMGISPDDMVVKVTVAVAAPEDVDTTRLQAMMPRGRASVTAVAGGMDIESPDGGDTIVLATAAIEAFLPNQRMK